MCCWLLLCCVFFCGFCVWFVCDELIVEFVYCYYFYVVLVVEFELVV